MIRGERPMQTSVSTRPLCILLLQTISVNRILCKMVFTTTVFFYLFFGFFQPLCLLCIVHLSVKQARKKATFGISAGFTNAFHSYIHFLSFVFCKYFHQSESSCTYFGIQTKPVAFRPFRNEGTSHIKKKKKM